MNPIVVIGGGISGSLIAYFLAKQGMSVTLVERSGIGTQASGNNPGGINPLHGPGIPGPMSGFAMHSHHLHFEFQAEIEALSGIEFQLHKVSRIEIALNGNEVSDLQKTQYLYNQTNGFSAQWLDQRALALVEPRISSEVVAGLLLEGNAMVDAHANTRAAAYAARAKGAELVEGEVRGIQHDGGRVTKVLLDHGALPCESVVIANGAWASEAENWLGIKIPVTPLKGELLLLDLPGKPLQHHVTHSIMGAYIQPDGYCWVGGTRDNVGYNAEPTQQGYESVMDGVARFIPSVRKARLIRQVAALRPATPDGLPIIGRAPGYDNAFLATGGGAKGMLLGIGMAESISSLIAGKEPPVSLEAFKLERFQD